MQMDKNLLNERVNEINAKLDNFVLKYKELSGKNNPKQAIDLYNYKLPNNQNIIHRLNSNEISLKSLMEFKNKFLHFAFLSFNNKKQQKLFEVFSELPEICSDVEFLMGNIRANVINNIVKLNEKNKNGIEQNQEQINLLKRQVEGFDKHNKEINTKFTKIDEKLGSLLEKIFDKKYGLEETNKRVDKLEDDVAAQKKREKEREEKEKQDAENKEKAEKEKKKKNILQKIIFGSLIVATVGLGIGYGATKINQKFEQQNQKIEQSAQKIEQIEKEISELKDFLYETFEGIHKDISDLKDWDVKLYYYFKGKYDSLKADFDKEKQANLDYYKKIMDRLQNLQIEIAKKKNIIINININNKVGRTAEGGEKEVVDQVSNEYSTSNHDKFRNATEELNNSIKPTINLGGTYDNQNNIRKALTK